jgi:hypothetical protein
MVGETADHTGGVRRDREPGGGVEGVVPAGAEQIADHRIVFLGLQGARSVDEPATRTYDRGRLTPSIPRGPGEAQRATGRLGAHRGGRGVDGVH